MIGRLQKEVVHLNGARMQWEDALSQASSQRDAAKSKACACHAPFTLHDTALQQGHQRHADRPSHVTGSAATRHFL